VLPDLDFTADLVGNADLPIPGTSWRRSPRRSAETPRALLHDINYVTGAQKLGWFAGLTKLGILAQSCYPDTDSTLEADLTAIGIDKSKWVVYNFGCPPEEEFTPDQSTEAAVDFKTAGVNHVMGAGVPPAGSATDPGFVQEAQAQGFDPKYAVMDDDEMESSDHASPAPPSSPNSSRP
jgi:hypothetical protein